MKSIVNWWKGSPKVRVAARTIAVAVATYAVQAWRGGELTDWRPFVDGAITAAITATAGILGLEPLVGIKSKVEVPAEDVKTT